MSTGIKTGYCFYQLYWFFSFSGGSVSDLPALDAISHFHGDRPTSGRVCAPRPE